MMSNLYAYVILAAVIVSGLGGAYIGAHLVDCDVVPENTAPAPAVKQQDGSVVAERAAPPIKPAPPPHQLPKGSKEERRVAVTVKPSKPESAPVRLDLSLVQVDGGRRVVASSPDGKVIEALDMPIQRAFAAPPARKWAAGGSADYRGDQFGAWVERDIGRFRVGAEVLEDDRHGLAGRVRVGFTF
jgi:hypothetical protein